MSKNLQGQAMRENVMSKLIVIFGILVVSTKSSSETWTDKKSWSSITNKRTIIMLLTMVTETQQIINE